MYLMLMVFRFRARLSRHCRLLGFNQFRRMTGRYLRRQATRSARLNCTRCRTTHLGQKLLRHIQLRTAYAAEETRLKLELLTYQKLTQ